VGGIVHQAVVDLGGVVVSYEVGVREMWLAIDRRPSNAPDDKSSTTFGGADVRTNTKYFPRPY
jgi:hypothetical protein